eukprot:6184235-Pleurochrysis_carterae.AAC.1
MIPVLTTTQARWCRHAKDIEDVTNCVKNPWYQPQQLKALSSISAGTARIHNAHRSRVSLSATRVRNCVA